jgi:hypothetical protein
MEKPAMLGVCVDIGAVAVSYLRNILLALVEHALGA